LDSTLCRRQLSNQSRDLSLEFIGRKWLDDVVVASGVNPVLDIGRLGHCRGREDRDVLSLRICAQHSGLAIHPSLAS
jgi:hypothetical protein